MSPFRFLSLQEGATIDSGYLVTLNMQHLYESRRNAALRRAIFHDRKARLCIDGRGAQIIFQRWLRKPLPLAAGNDVLRTRLDQSSTARVLVIGSDPDTLAIMQQRYPRIEFVHDGSLVPAFVGDLAEKHAAALVARYGLDFSFAAVALGVPKQEILAQALAYRMTNMPILCIGGSFEMIAGRHRRSPRLLQSLGLEGMWRLFIEPSRKRLWRLATSYWFFVRLLSNVSAIEALVR